MLSRLSAIFGSKGGKIAIVSRAFTIAPTGGKAVYRSRSSAKRSLRSAGRFVQPAFDPLVSDCGTGHQRAADRPTAKVSSHHFGRYPQSAICVPPKQIKTSSKW
jgi:hypothetical protein